MCDHNCSWCQIGMAVSMLCKEKAAFLSIPIVKAVAVTIEEPEDRELHDSEKVIIDLPSEIN
jgi:hypothetical protein